MKNLLDLPYDILLIILHYFISISTVEELIRLEIVCKQLRQLCLSRTCLLDALEMLETRPPLKSSRSSLLDLCAADLREEIVRAVKLDQSWMTEGGPSRKESMFIHSTEVGQYYDILPLPEVELIFASHANGIHCWSTSQRKLVWEYLAKKEHQDPQPPPDTDFSNVVMRFACDVADDFSFILIAVIYKREQRQAGERYMRYIQVHQLDTATLNSKLLLEIPYMYGLNRYHDMVYIRDDYVAIKTTDRTNEGFVIMNWRKKSYYRIQSRKRSIPLTFTMTRDTMFLAHLDRWGPCRLASIRYRDVSGTSSSLHGDWPVHELVELQTQDVYSLIVLPYRAQRKLCSSNPLRCRIAAEVSTWSRHPTTRITATFAEMYSGRHPGERVSIFDIKFTHDADGRDTFVIVHEYKTQGWMTFLSTPSVTSRAIIYDAGTGWTSTFAVAFNEYNEGAHLERINRLQLPEDSEGIATYLRLRMDPLGRMLVYPMPLAKCIVVIRFDE